MCCRLRVTVDLTALGGPAEVELASGGGDDYILRVHLELDLPKPHSRGADPLRAGGGRRGLRP